jgi:hypothetical protein
MQALWVLQLLLHCSPATRALLLRTSLSFTQLQAVACKMQGVCRTLCWSWLPLCSTCLRHSNQKMQALQLQVWLSSAASMQE